MERMGDMYMVIVQRQPGEKMHWRPLTGILEHMIHNKEVKIGLFVHTDRIV